MYTEGEVLQLPTGKRIQGGSCFDDKACICGGMLCGLLARNVVCAFLGQLRTATLGVYIFGYDGIDIGVSSGVFP